MFEPFEFDLPGILTRQLQRRLNAMPADTLTQAALRDLGHVQQDQKLSHGIYQLLLKDKIVYVWKASDVRKRLEQHHWKLTGRQRVRPADVRFRSLLMHRSWSIISDEHLLISHYKAKGLAKWNGAGFALKDFGRNRDGTEPSWFDRNYPINADYPCNEIPNEMMVGTLAEALKSQLPFVFRHEAFSRSEIAKPVCLKKAPRTALALIQALVDVLGPAWQATLFRSHAILYKESQLYPHGETILAKPSK